MRVLTFQVPPEKDGVQVKVFLRKDCGVSARMLTRLKQTAGGMTVCGSLLYQPRPVRSIDILHAGEEIRLVVSEEELRLDRALLPPILYEDEDFLVFHKPAAMPVHPSPGHEEDSLYSAWQRATGGATMYPLYRLDKDTSGVLVCAKNSFVACNAVVKKQYFAICEGILSGEGIISVPIGYAPGSIIQRQTGQGVPAVTRYRVLKSAGAHTAIVLVLQTGRTHQIRVHLQSIGHPLAGDDLYGGSRSVCNRQALHCRQVSFARDAGSPIHTVQAEIPVDLKKAFPELIP